MSGEKVNTNYVDYPSCVMARNKKGAIFSWHLIVCTDETNERFVINGGFGADSDEQYKKFKHSRKLRQLNRDN